MQPTPIIAIKTLAAEIVVFYDRKCRQRTDQALVMDSLDLYSKTKCRMYKEYGSII